MHPILFNAGPITIYSYGVLLASAYLLGLWLAVKRARAAGIDGNRIMDLLIWVIIAALVGAKEHALRQAVAGVDIVVAQGGEAGGHCGEVSTLVLVPEVVRALAQAGYDTPVLAAGGIMTGGQMTAMMAAGAQGAGTGSGGLAPRGLRGSAERWEHGEGRQDQGGQRRPPGAALRGKSRVSTR